MSASTPPEFGSTMIEETPATRWPKIIGIICLVLGGVGAICGITTVIGTFFMKSLAKLVEGQPAPPGGGPTPAELIEASAKHQGLTATVAVVGLLTACFLLYCGIRLITRKANARKLLLAWASIKGLEVIFATWVGFMNAKAQVALYNDYEVAAEGAGNIAAMSMITIVAGALFGLALPVFMAIWLNRPAIKAETSAWQ